MKKRILAVLLCFCLLVGLVPTAAFAIGTDTGKAIQLGIGGITGYDSTDGYDYIYFGYWDAQDEYTASGPVKWRVLDDQTNTGGDGLFLLSDELYGTGTDGGVYFDNTRNPNSNAWQGSDAQKWCNSFYSTNLTQQEQNAILATTKSDEEYTVDNEWQTKYDASENILSGDKVFFLSVEEAETGNYGFINNTARIAYYGNNRGSWLLRSPNTSAFSGNYFASLVSQYGEVSSTRLYDAWAARPAFNLDLNAVLFTSAAVGGKSSDVVGADSLQTISDYSGNEWKLTLKDDSRSFSVTETTAANAPGGTITLNYTGATAGTNEYISAIIEDSNGAQYYGRLKNITVDAETSGTVELTIPSGLAEGSYTLKVFSEQCNGDKMSDYASAFVNIPLTVDENTITYTLTVDRKGGVGGTTGGSYTEGAVISIDAGTRPAYRFSGWTSSNGGSFADASSASTTFTMPAEDTTITASWQYDADIGQAIQPDTGGITGYSDTGSYDYIYFGYWVASDSYTTSGPIKWRVLDDQTNTGGAGLFLLSDVGLGTEENGGVYYQHYSHQDTSSGEWHKGAAPSDGDHSTCQISNAWQGSDAQSWCNSFYSTNLTTREQSAVLATTKSDGAYTSSSSYSFVASENILSGDRVFFLSAEEAETGDYGFTDNNSRIAWYGNDSNRRWNWWLRSPLAHTLRESLVYYYNGTVRDDGGSFGISMARPAFNLDLNAVLFTSAAVGSKADAAVDSSLTAVGNYDGNEWKLTLKDDSRNNFTASTDSDTAKYKGYSDWTVDVSYENAQTGDNEYVSVLLCDSSDNVLYYGRIAQNKESGTASVTIPSGLEPDSYTLKVFSEQYNGDKMTDYAGNFVAIPLTVTLDTVAPTLTEGTVSRTSDNEATVTFTSDEAGTYYYAVVESGETEPDIDTTGTGTACDTTEQTISLDNLTGAGAKDIYIVVKDAAGNVSDPLKMTIPAAVPTLTGGEVTRDSESTASVKFTSNKAGTYYYAVVESGDTEPDIDTTGAGTACDTTEQTISLDNLTGEDAKDIYIVVKDAEGIESDKLKMTIPAYTEPSYSIAVDRSTLNFLSQTEGYTSVVISNVNVFNTGTRNVTVTLPASENYTITGIAGFTNDTADLAPDGMATFSVTPKRGLVGGNYDETLTISGSNGASASMELYFTVTHNYGTDWETDADKHWHECSCGAKADEAEHEYDDEQDTICNVCGYERTGAPVTYTLTVDLADGSGSTTGGEYAEGDVINIDAGTRTDYRFNGWTSSNGGSFDDASSASTTFTMPAADTTITASWLDDAAPTGEIKIAENSWKTFLNNITFDLFFKDTQTVTITAEDNSGETVTIEYMLSDKELTKDELTEMTFTAYSAPFGINPDNEYVIYAKLTDTSGNVAYINTDGIVLDATDPVISGIENGKTYCGAQTVTITEEYIDTVTVNGKEVTLDSNHQFILNPAEGTQTIVVTDKAGNETTVSVTVNDGHTLTKTEAKEATCTEDGNTEYWTCETCGKYFSDAEGNTEISLSDTVIKATDHKLTKTEAKEATCTEAGNTEYWTCETCGKYFSDADGKTEIALADTVIEAIGHKLTKTEAKAATCTEDGNIEYWYCETCGKYFSDAEGKTEITLADTVIEATGHKLTKTEAKAATCTEDGNTEYWTCETCGKYFSDAEGKTEITLADTVIKATGHKLTKTEAKAATCTEDGNTEYWTCETCGKYFSDAEGNTEISLSDTVIKATGHKLTHTPAKAACTEDGNIEYWYCDVCGKYFSDAEGKTEIALSDTVIEATGHKLTKTEAKAATCAEDGNTEYWTCETCGKYFSDAEGKTEISLSDTVIKATGHKLTKTEAKEATCTEDGNIEYWYCETCGKYFSDAEGNTEITLSDTVIKATGHKLTHTPAKAACTEDGNIEYWYCETCGKYFSDAEGKTEITLADTVIEATGHKLTHTPAKAATCTEEGNREYWTCDTCGRFFEDESCKVEITDLDTWKVIPKVDHTWSSDYLKEHADAEKHYHICTVCGTRDAGEAHTWNVETATEETDKHCTVCGYVAEAQLGHVHVGMYVAGEDATCTEEGSKEYYSCSCGKFFEDESCTIEITDLDTWKVIPKLDHTWSADCLEEHADAEKHYHVCTVCGTKDAGEAHTWNVEAADEETDKHCTVCGYVAEERLEHVHTLTYTAGKDATCTEPGNKEYWMCETCGKHFSDAEGKTEITLADTVIEAIGHKLTKTEAKAATCTEEGNTEYWTCEICGKHFSDAEGKTEITLADTVIPATGHKAGTAWKSDGNGHWNECVNCGDKMNEAAHTYEWVTDKEPTATEAGARHEECEVCGYAKAAVEIPATGTTEEPSEPSKPGETPSEPSKDTNTPNGGGQTGDTTSPQTGDNSPIVLWMILLFISAGGLGITVYRKRKKQ